MAGIFDQAAAQFSNRMLNGQSELIPKTLGGRIDSTIQNSWDGEAMANIINEGGKGGNMIFDTLANQAEQEKVAGKLKEREDRIYGDKIKINTEIEKGMTELYGDAFRNSGLPQYQTDKDGMTNDQIVDTLRTPQMNPITGEMTHHKLSKSQQDAFENNAGNFLIHDIMKNSNGQIKSLDDAKNLMERAARGDIDPRVVMLQQNMGQEKFAKVSQLVGAMSENKRLTEMARSSVLDEKDQNEINTWNQLHNRKSIAAAKSRGAEEAKLEHEMVSNQELSRQAQMLPELAVEAEAKKEQMMMALELIKAGKSPAEARRIVSEYTNSNGGSSNFMGSGNGQGSGNGSGSGFIPRLGSGNTGGSGSGQGSGDTGGSNPPVTNEQSNIPVKINDDGTVDTNSIQIDQDTGEMNLGGLNRPGYVPGNYEESYRSLTPEQKERYDDSISHAQYLENIGMLDEAANAKRSAQFLLQTGQYIGEPVQAIQQQRQQQAIYKPDSVAFDDVMKQIKANGAVDLSGLSSDQQILLKRYYDEYNNTKIPEEAKKNNPFKKAGVDPRRHNLGWKNYFNANKVIEDDKTKQLESLDTANKSIKLTTDAKDNIKDDDGDNITNAGLKERTNVFYTGMLNQQTFRNGKESLKIAGRALNGIDVILNGADGQKIMKEIDNAQGKQKYDIWKKKIYNESKFGSEMEKAMNESGQILTSEVINKLGIDKSVLDADMGREFLAYTYYLARRSNPNAQQISLELVKKSAVQAAKDFKTFRLSLMNAGELQRLGEKRDREILFKDTPNPRGWIVE